MLLIRPVLSAYFLDLSKFLLGSGLSYFKALYTMLVCFVSASGCHCFDYLSIKQLVTLEIIVNSLSGRIFLMEW